MKKVKAYSPLIFGGIIGLLVGLGLMYTSLQKKNTEKTGQSNVDQSLSTEERDRLVRYHLELAEKKISVAEDMAKINNQNRAPTLKNSKSQVSLEKPDIGVTFDEERHHMDAGQNGQDAWRYRETNLSEAIDAEVYNDKAKRQSALDYKKAYAKAFVESARKDGYEVEIDSEFRVVSIRKIKKLPKGPSIFDR